MKSNKSKIRHSTIMFTDIVGYSKMVEKGEEDALFILEEHNQILTSIIKNNSGKIIKHIGDSIFAEFKNNKNCVISAINIQDELKKRNDISRNSQKITIRIGIHTGTVYEREDDLFGNDVNLCSRIEGIAPHGGIAASINVFDDLKIDNIFNREIGYVKLKNIKSPQLLYKIYLDKEDHDAETNNDLKKNQIEHGTNIVDINSYQTEVIYSIGLLNIESVSNKNDDLSYIIADRLISQFQKIKDINMPNINDSQFYKNSDLPLSEIARRLEVDNLIYGNISNTKNQLVINLNMLDTTNGERVWTEKFIGKQANLGNLCGKIIDSLLNHFNIDVPNKITKLISTSMSSSSSAIEYYYKGMNLIEKTKSTDDLQEAKINFTKAIEKDNDFVESMAQLAITCEKLGYFHEADEYIQKAIHLSESLGNESSQAMVYNCAGILYKAWNKYTKAIPFFKNALKIQVHLEDQFMEAKILSSLAGCYTNTQEPETALRLLSKSISIKEKLEEGKSLAYSYAELGNTNIIIGDLSESILHLQKSLGKFIFHEMDFHTCRNLILLTQIHLDIGDISEAKRYLTKSHPICDELNEPLMLGKYYFFKGKLLENKNIIDKAKENYSRSIEYFQEGDLHRPMINSIISLSMLQVKTGLFAEAKKNYNKANTALKRIQEPLTELYIKANRVYMNSLFGECTLNQCDDITQKLKNNPGNNYFFREWWLIAKAYYHLKSQNQAIYAQKKAQEILIICSKLISNNDHRKTFLHSDFIKKEIWLDLSKVDLSVNKYKITKNILKFCPNCRCSNEEQTKFCSECGNSLLKN